MVKTSFFFLLDFNCFPYFYQELLEFCGGGTERSVQVIADLEILTNDFMETIYVVTDVGICHALSESPCLS